MLSYVKMSKWTCFAHTDCCDKHFGSKSNVVESMFVFSHVEVFPKSGKENQDTPTIALQLCLQVSLVTTPAGQFPQRLKPLCSKQWLSMQLVLETTMNSFHRSNNDQIICLPTVNLAPWSSSSPALYSSLRVINLLVATLRKSHFTMLVNRTGVWKLINVTNEWEVMEPFLTTQTIVTQMALQWSISQASILLAVQRGYWHQLYYMGYS